MHRCLGIYPGSAKFLGRTLPSVSGSPRKGTKLDYIFFISSDFGIVQTWFHYDRKTDGVATLPLFLGIFEDNYKLIF